jgi:hypothetical protein
MLKRKKAAVDFSQAAFAFVAALASHDVRSRALKLQTNS